MISEKTGVIVAPVILSGYSIYHSGFPGTLSLKPETMEQVLFESIEMLQKYGFKRFMFFNGHGGNNIIQSKVIHRINHNTEAIAVSIGYGSSLQKKEYKEKNEDFFDWHAGKEETSIMLYLFPQLVKMERAEKPEIHFTSQMEQLKALSEENPELLPVFDNLFGVPPETKKGGASHEISSNGIWSFHDPKSATVDIGRNAIDKLVKKAIKFIETWKQTDK